MQRRSPPMPLSSGSESWLPQPTDLPRSRTRYDPRSPWSLPRSKLMLPSTPLEPAALQRAGAPAEHRDLCPLEAPGHNAAPGGRRDLRRMPTVWALEWLVRSGGRRGMTESSFGRRSLQGTPRPESGTCGRTPGRGGGSGTGALTQVICLRGEPGSIVACDPSRQLVSFARLSLGDHGVSFHVADASQLPRRDDGFDAVVSGLVLNFLPRPSEAVRAMRNRIRPGGTLAAYVWDYAGGMQILRIFWAVAGD